MHALLLFFMGGVDSVGESYAKAVFRVFNFNTGTFSSPKFVKDNSLPATLSLNFKNFVS